MPESPPALSVSIYNEVFRVLYEQVGHSTAIRMTRQELEAHAPIIPQISILGCLQKYEGDKLINCTKKDVIFTPQDLNNDYNEFHLTSLGANTANHYSEDKDHKIIVQ